MTLVSELREWNGQESICQCRELAMRAADYIDDILLKDCGKTREINILTKENKRLREVLETLASQHSGIVGSTRLSDLMAVMARNALRSSDNQ